MPTSDLVKDFKEYEAADRKFKYGIFNSANIEGALLSASNGKGWFLACRYFPKSYSRLFGRFLQTIQHYKYADVKSEGEHGLVLSGPGGRRASSNPSDKGRRRKIKLEMVRQANEYITFVIHESFYVQVLQEIVERWPECFEFWGITKVRQLQPKDIVPTFDSNSLLAIANRCSILDTAVVAAIWARWNYEKAVECYMDVRAKWGLSISRDMAHKLISVPCIARYSPMNIMDLMTRFVAFSGAWTPDINIWKEFIVMSKIIGIVDKVSERLETEVSRLSQDDQKYLLHKFGSNVMLPEVLIGLTGCIKPEDLLQIFASIDSRFAANLYVPFTNLSNRRIRWEIVPSDEYKWHDEQVKKRSSELR
jgi:hypothetical protein